MPGGALQLVLTGYADTFLVSDPQITFFRQVYKRHTNFAVEPIPQYFNVKPDFGSRVTCTISKIADLINKIYLVVNLPPIGKFIDYPDEEGEGNSKIASCAWTKKIGWNLIKQVELEIGGNIIERQYGDWLNIYTELTVPISKRKGLDKMIGNIPEIYENTNGKKAFLLYIPLMFWFCRNVNMSLPIIALDNSDVKINIEFNQLDDCLILSPSHYITINEDLVNLKTNEIIKQEYQNNIYYARFNYFDIITKKLYYTKITPEQFITNVNIIGVQSKYIITPINNEKLYLDKNRYFSHIINLSLNSAYLLVDYIYLDILERINFAKREHTYLIDYIQFDNDKLLFHSNNKIKLGYKNPVKEIIFRGNYDYLIKGYSKEFFNYTNNTYELEGENIIKRASILLNGQDRIKEKTNNYFEYIQNYQYHTVYDNIGINTYNFSLKPEDSIPSGTCNFSNCDDIVINLTLDKGISYKRPIKIKIYAFTYNVLKIANGLAKILF
jgi:hypothetical protein